MSLMSWGGISMFSCSLDKNRVYETYNFYSKKTSYSRFVIELVFPAMHKVFAV